MKLTYKRVVLLAILGLATASSFAETRILFCGRTSGTAAFDVYSVKTDGTDLKQHSNTPNISEWSVDLSPDQTQYTFVERNSKQLYIAPMDTGVPSAVGSVTAYAARWEDDSNLIFTARASTATPSTDYVLKRIKTDGTGEEQICSTLFVDVSRTLATDQFFYDRPRNEVYIPAWSPQNDMRIYKWDFDANSPATMISSYGRRGYEGMYTPAISPDGAQFIFATDGGGFDHSLYATSDLGGTTSHPLLFDLSAHPSWGADSSWIAYVQGTSNPMFSSYIGNIHTRSVGGAANEVNVTKDLTVAGGCTFPLVYETGGTTLDLDTDDDGMNDIWEDEFLNGTNLDATGDLDQDGLSNLQEYIAGTDPDDDQDKLELNMTIQANGSVDVAYASRVASTTHYPGQNRVYTLETKTNLTAQTWVEVAGEIDVAGSGTTRTLNIATPTDGQFYRLTVELQ